jgi:hypothetical protein
MEIIYNNKVPFDVLKEGDVFKYNTILFMKISTLDKIYNAVRIDNGKCTDFVNEYVEPVKGKFVMD